MAVVQAISSRVAAKRLTKKICYADKNTTTVATHKTHTGTARMLRKISIKRRAENESGRALGVGNEVRAQPEPKRMPTRKTTAKMNAKP